MEPDLFEKYHVTEEDLKRTPPSVLRLIQGLFEEIALLRKRIEELEARLNRSSSNSHKPPSSDPPYRKKEKPKTSGGKSGGKPGHPGHRRQLLEPGEIVGLRPETCSRCGHSVSGESIPYYTHQVIELPEIHPRVTHFVLHRSRCPLCGKVEKALLPEAYRSGFGPNLSAAIAEICGVHGGSRSAAQAFCSSVLGVRISLGAIQKVLDRVSGSIESHYQAIAERVLNAAVNHVDETSWNRKGFLEWLWVMTNSAAAFFMIHSNRSKEAFQSLIQDWEGILVSDGYGVYTRWTGLRQTCLAHLIREARGLSERSDPRLARFGTWALSELQRLCHMARQKPRIGEWRTFYARLIRLIALNIDRDDDAGRFARRLKREIDSLWIFLVEEGVSPTNNHAERMLRFAVLWRKRSQGTASEKGDRWAERILSLRQTCTLRGLSTYRVLVDAVSSHFQNRLPDISWI